MFKFGDEQFCVTNNEIISMSVGGGCVDHYRVNLRSVNESGFRTSLSLIKKQIGVGEYVINSEVDEVVLERGKTGLAEYRFGGLSDVEVIREGIAGEGRFKRIPKN